MEMSAHFRVWLVRRTLIGIDELPDRPLAVRATAEIRRSWLMRRRRAFRFDVCDAQGRVSRNVNLDKLLCSRRYPADYWVTRAAAEEACPDLGTGAWVSYPSGMVLDSQPN